MTRKSTKPADPKPGAKESAPTTVRRRRAASLGGCVLLLVGVIVGVLAVAGELPEQLLSWAGTAITTAQFEIVTVTPASASAATVSAPTAVNTRVPATRRPAATAAVPTTVALPTSTIAAGRSPSWLTVYFTDPQTAARRSILDTAILPAIARATRSIDVAMFDLNLPSFVQALADAKARGVTVRVVLDGMNGNTTLAANQNNGQAFDAIKALRDAQIPISDGGRSSGLMHAKIIIIDGTTLFIGSWNAAYNDTFRNDNNILRIVNPQLVLNYQAEFDDMFVNKQFGAKSVLRAIQPVLTISGTPVENYFAPRDRVMDKLITEANKARRSIRVMAFTFTSDEMAQQLISQAKLGVDVQVVIESRGASQGVRDTLFCAKNANLAVRNDGNPGTMHHKVIIIDDSTVITGSFNFTKAANTTNDDSVLIIRHARVAAQFNAEFERVYALASVPDGIRCR